MKPRERVVAALNHEQPDRVPLDFGGGTSSIHVGVYTNLLAELGRHEDVLSMDSGVACPSEALLEKFHIDTRQVYPEIAKLDTNPPLEKTDAWGVRMRLMGNLYEDLPDAHPLAGIQTVDELREYPWPKSEDLISQATSERMAGTAEKLAGGDYAVVLPFGPLSGPFALSMRLRGYQKFLADLRLRPKIAEAIMDRMASVVVDIVKKYVKPIGEYLDVVNIADDLGTQQGPMISPQTYKTRVKPKHQRIVEALRNSTRASVILHTDGSIAPFIDDFAEVGITGINPVQVSARGMDSRELKEKFGSKMAFWGGIDGQQVLPFGTVEDVKLEVRRRIDDLADGGGYVLASVHHVQPPTPPRNVITMFNEALTYGSSSKDAR